MSLLNEAHVEIVALRWLDDLGYITAHGPDIAHDGDSSERSSYADVILVGRLRSALTDINRAIPPEAIEEAIRKIQRPETPSLIENNERFHCLVTEGVDVEYRRQHRLDDQRERASRQNCYAATSPLESRRIQPSDRRGPYP